MKKVIVVTGGSGFVGLNLINHLLKKEKNLNLLLIITVQEIKKII